ncbi:DUF2130 domain-containing protein [Mycoplasma buteonis]|uniref:DUF2130 domain-containing protein n=1 Tax=Mycoplasma buteonis TaxID=171280 RepID=UPI00056B8A75|nr:DUF2130 domain-containing protein [Mycoplasma buteonis]
MKKIKFKLKNIDNYEFEILEDAPKGSYFSLSDWLTDDTAAIQKLLSEKQGQIIESIKIEAQKNIENNWENIGEVQKLKEQLNNQINFLKNQLVILETKQETEISKNKLDVEKEFRGKLENANLENLELKNKLTLKERELQDIFVQNERKMQELVQLAEIKKNSFLLAKEKEIAELKHEVEKVQFETKNKLLQEFNEKLNAEKLVWNEEKHKLEIEMAKLQGKYEGVITRKTSTGLKIAANEFEDAVYDTISNTFGVFTDEVHFQKTTKPVEYQDANNITKKAMPDFEVTFFDPKNNEIPIGKIVIEAKSIQSNTGSKSNVDFLKKLEIDRKNFKADKAILVTELNPEDDFFILNNKEYPNIYIIRIDILSNLLKLFFLIAKKEAEMKSQFEIYRSQTLEKNMILQKFNDFKNEIINIQVKNLNNSVNVLLKEVKKLRDSALSIEKIAETTIKRQTELVESKINNFNIERKIILPLEKLNHFDKEINIFEPEKEISNKIEKSNALENIDE